MADWREVVPVNCIGAVIIHVPSPIKPELSFLTTRPLSTPRFRSLKVVGSLFSFLHPPSPTGRVGLALKDQDTNKILKPPIPACTAQFSSA
jgi:hypothetical protein